MLTKLWGIGKKDGALIATKAAANQAGVDGNELMNTFFNLEDNSSIGEIQGRSPNSNQEI